MLANPVLRTSLCVPRMILLPVVPVMNLFMWMSFFIPFIRPIYMLLLKVLWLPFAGYIMSTAWIYQKARVLRPILAIVSIPLLVILDIFILIIPNPNEVDKCNKASMIDSWPLPQGETANKNLNVHLALNDGRVLRYGADNLPGSAKVIACPLCGDMVRADWRKCPRCRSWLNGHGTQFMSGNAELYPTHFDALHTNKSRFEECSLCGEMVRAQWVDCPRCGEKLSGVNRLSLYPAQQTGQSNAGKASRGKRK